MKKIALGGLVLGWASLVGAAELSVDFTFSAADVELTAVGEYTAIELADGSRVVDEVGAPSIPAKFANVLLPAGAQNVSISASGDRTLLAEGITPYPAQPRSPKSFEKPAFVPANDRYASADPWPAATATYQGDHDMQGYQFVSVRVNPLVYVGAEKKLYLRERVTVTVTYDAAPATKTIYPSQQAVFEPLVNSLVVNPAAAKDFAPAVKTAAPRASAQYLIITRAALTNSFKVLQTSRASRFTTDMLTVESITNTYSGTDAQAKIRACIQTYVSNNATAYVVLGGDNTIVPARGCWVDVDGETETAMPTDLYYSGLSGNWNSDGDANYGETSDGVDMAWDVVVARIPVRTTTHANAYINKLLAFEANPNRYDGKMLLGGMYAWDTYTGTSRPSDNCTNSDHHADFRYAAHTSVSDSEMWDRRLYRDGVLPYWTATNQIAIFCDTLTTWDTTFGSGNYSQTASNLKGKFNQGWYHMFFSGHGDTTLWGLESGSFGTADASSMTNLIVFAYTDACLTGGFDDGEPSLSEAFLRNAGGGALIYMGCSRYGWGSPDASPASNTSDGGPSTVYGYKFYKRLHETTGRTVGTAFAMHKADMISLSGTDDCERWIQFGMNLQGDPVLSLEPLGDQPPALQPVPAQSVTVGQALSFTVTATDGDGDTVRLTASGLPAGATFAGATGTVSVSSTFNWTPAATGSYSVTFYAGDKDGTNSTAAAIAVNPRAKPSLATTPAGASVNAVVSNLFTLTVQATEADGDTVSIGSLSLPAWATFAGATGAAPVQVSMTGTPTATGTYSAVFRAADVDGAVTSTVQIVVTEAPSVIDIGGYQLTQLNATYDYVIPDGTFIPVNGYVVIGRNTTKDLFESAWGVTLGDDVVYLNSGGSMPVINGDETYTLYDASSALVEGPTPALTSGYTRQRIHATNDATLSGSWTSVAMASATPGSGGVGNGTAGLVICEYADAGAYANEFIELFYDGVAGSQPAQAPGIAVSGGTNQSVLTGATLTFDVTATDPEDNDVMLIADSKPAGSTFTDLEGASPQVGTFSWTPSTAGNYEAVFVAADSADGMETTQRVAIAVLSSVGAAPVITVTGGTNQSATVSNLLTFTVTATDPEDNDVILVDDAKPAGATFDGVEGASPQSCVFSWTPTAAGSFEAIFVAADDYDGAESTQRVAITVTGSGGGGGMETFANYTGSGSSYVTNTFAGQDGSTWIVGKARGDIQINGASPTIRNQVDAYIRSGTIAGGVGSLSFKYRKPFSDSVMDNKVYVIGQNSAYTGTVTTVPSTTNEVLTFTATGVNVEGDFVLVITNSASTARITVDDIEWTGYSTGGGTPTVEVVALPTNATEHLSLELSASQVGSQYVLEYTTNLLAVPQVFIQAAPGVNGTGGTITLQDPTNAPVGDGRFYRIVEY
ncbi:MAG: C25 family cysteine peptidase [Kiritimatiellia bacterium]